MLKSASVLGLLLWAAPSPAQAQAPPAPPSEAAARCSALGASDFSRLLDAPTHLTAAKLVEAVADAPAYCQVQGYVAPAVGFELRLPASAWNGKFFMAGCGGFCGTVLASACAHPLRRGYACIATDMGHKSTGLDAKWAYNNPQAEIDFGYRATHVTAVAGKAITEQFYAQAPGRSYFMGCSTGGRQGLVEAQKFPWDFDGIVAGAPVINETGAGMQLIWSTVVNRDKAGQQILGVDKLKLINDAVTAKCDLQDNIRDGIIGDPRACGFDPAALKCKGGAKPDCLTAAQVDVVRKIYAGPKNSKGEALYTGGAQPSSELNWADNYISKGAGSSIYENFIGDLWRYMGFMPDPGPNWQPKNFDFDRDHKRLGLMETMYSGSNPDLRAFKTRGGKMISYQGWADQSVVPLNVIDYYELAERTMGGRKALQEFYRLFMVPGMNHCRGGVGADAIDYLSYLETWVEKGEAPDMMLGARVKPEVAMDFQSGYRFPIAPEQAQFTRPHYPYPLQYRFKGTGDGDDAANYEAVAP